jgi:hypothetical protein
MHSLIHDIEHHAKDKADLVYTLAVLFASELNPVGWQALRARNGNNSWRIYLRQDGKPTKIWYFTGYQKGSITVRNDYYWARANRRFTMKTRVDAIRFVRQIANA